MVKKNDPETQVLAEDEVESVSGGDVGTVGGAICHAYSGTCVTAVGGSCFTSGPAQRRFNRRRKTEHVHKQVPSCSTASSIRPIWDRHSRAQPDPRPWPKSVRSVSG